MPDRRSELPLASMQAAFATSLLARDDSVPGHVTSGNHTAPLKRFNVYRNNVFASLTETLRARFPVVARLVGEAFFRAMASAFAGAHPPRSPALLEYGADFPDFLAGFDPVQALPYLPDVARLEWLRHAAYHARDLDPMDGASLAAVSSHDIGRVVLQLHPSAGLIASAYPVFSIWRTNALDAEVRPIGPEMGGEAALVLRPRLDVVTMLLPPGGGAFIGAIAEGAELASAAETAMTDASDFALAEVLGACIARGAFTDFSFKGGI
jgi:hypothetical protein